MNVTEQQRRVYKMVQHQYDLDDAQCIYNDLMQNDYPGVSFPKETRQELYEEAVSKFRSHHDWNISDYDQLCMCISMEIAKRMEVKKA